VQARENEGIAIPNSYQEIRFHSKGTSGCTSLVGNLSFLISLNGSKLNDLSVWATLSQKKAGSMKTSLLYLT
jgi:hypothetical protein